MTRADLTSLPPEDPTSLYQYRDCLYAVDLMTAAVVGLQFFDWLAGRAQHTATTAEILQHFECHERPLDVMLTLFRSRGYLQTCAQNGTHQATPLAISHLTHSSEWDLTPYFASLHDRPVARDFLTVLRTDRPAGWSGDKNTADWHAAMEDPAFAKKFTAAMDCRGRHLAAALTAKCRLKPGDRLLDIGGGSGIYACAFIDSSLKNGVENVSAAVLEQPPVDRICRNAIAERGYSELVEVIAGDMFGGIPTGFNAHLFSNVLHDWGHEEVSKLLKLSAATLPTGGNVIIHDAFISPEKSGPVHVAEYSALLMHSTQGKCWSTAEYAEILHSAGFVAGAFSDTALSRGFMVGTKL